MEKLAIELGIDKNQLKKDLGQAKDDIKGFKDRVKSEQAIELSVNLARLKAQLATVRQSLKRDLPKEASIVLSAKAERLSKEVTQAGRELTNFLRTGQKDVSVLGNMFSNVGAGIKNSLSIVGGALAGVAALGKFKDLSDSFIGMQNSLRQITSEDNLQKLQGRILNLANESRVPVEGLTNSFVRYDKVIRAMGGTQEDTFVVMDSLSKSLVSAGRTAEETSSVMLQLSQAFASGKLMGDEFRSLSENMPGIMDILAKSMGVPRGKLKELSSEGKITAQVLKKALMEANGEINDAFGKSQMTISQKLTQIRNNFIVAFGEFDKTYGFTEKVIGGIDGLIDSVKFLGTVFSTTYAGISEAIQSAGEFLGIFGEEMTEQERLAKQGEGTVYDYKSAIEALAGTEYAPNTAGYQKERAEIIKNIEKSIELLKVREQLGIQAAANANNGKTTTGAGSTAPESRPIIPGSELKLNLDGITGNNEGIKGFSEKSMSIIGAPVNKEIQEAQKALETIDQKVAKIRRDAKNAAGGGGGGGKGKSPESLAKDEIERQKKIMQANAELEIRAVNASTDSERDKATKIVAINKNLKEQIELLDGKYYEVQAKRAEEFLKQEEKNMNERKKGQEDLYDKANDKEKKQIDNIKKLSEYYTQLKSKLKETGKQGAEDIKKINDEIEKLKKNLSDITSEGTKDIANRGLEAAKELQEIKDKQAKGEGITEEELQSRFALEKEIELVNANTTGEDRKNALAQAAKSQTQLLLEEIKLSREKAEIELEEAETKRRMIEEANRLSLEGIQNIMDATAVQITEEAKLLLKQDTNRRKMESDYTEFFGEQIAARKDIMNELLEKAKEVQLALQTAGINTNTGGVVTNTTASSIIQNYNITNATDAESVIRAFNNLLPTR